MVRVPYTLAREPLWHTVHTCTISFVRVCHQLRALVSRRACCAAASGASVHQLTALRTGRTSTCHCTCSLTADRTCNGKIMIVTGAGSPGAAYNIFRSASTTPATKTGVMASDGTTDTPVDITLFSSQYMSDYG